ncbi:hypothetical protein E1292_35265 [Nonomuraea deserti]|uniref:Uncharacterized protein n=1 Tax=Nonomuraea deserti TaxID=1848322 RepID=A0A4R4V1S6_9ACTN|nr:hypothetical protein [Nonomuraea deserti]TDC98500.1 hypothetical protein E1292_35265 [Nonomuraea deserti]
MSSISPQPCDKCRMLVIPAYLFASGGVRIVLDAIPVTGGDYTMWPIGYDPENLRLLVARRPAQVAPPHEAPKLVLERWDGYRAADERTWYVEHQHDVTSAEIVERRGKE